MVERRLHHCHGDDDGGGGCDLLGRGMLDGDRGGVVHQRAGC